MASTVGNLQNEFQHKHPHYHLRPNKAVDRLLFIDIIKAFNIRFDIRDYRYIGFGGPYLEDFKLLAYAFPEIHMISVEEDEETFKRQEFHKCSQNLELIQGSFEEFLDNTEKFDAHPVIAWIDYTDNKIEHFREIETLSKKMIANSLVRFTLKAQPLNMNAHPLANERLRKRTKQICHEYLLDEVNEQDMFKNEGFSEIICQLAEKAICRGLDSGDLVFMPLHKVRYSDGTQMVSITGIICEDNSNELLEDMKKMCFYIDGGQEIDVINIPSLTVKERFHIERYLPNPQRDGATIAKELGYMVGKDEEDNLRLCKQYEKYYPYYPYFNKIIP